LAPEPTSKEKGRQEKIGERRGKEGREARKVKGGEERAHECGLATGLALGPQQVVVGRRASV